MKKGITKQEQSYINSLLDKRKNKSVKTKSIDGKERLAQYEWDNTEARNGMTYLEIEQLNNTYNNFR